NQSISGSDPTQAANDTDAARAIHLTPLFRARPRAVNRLRGKKGSGANRAFRNRNVGSCNRRIAPTTQNESWKPTAKSSFVSQQRIRVAAAARLLNSNAFRSTMNPPSKTALITAAR